ncbi:MAG: VOC family protein [Pseudomonadota bacterium]
MTDAPPPLPARFPPTLVGQPARAAMLRATLDLPPMQMSEIVLKTARYEDMKTWYQAVLGVAPSHEHLPARPAVYEPGRALAPADLKLCFIRILMQHPYSQVLAIFEVPGTPSTQQESPGLHHMQFRNPSMDVLFTRYERLKALGIVPQRTMNHGPGTSFYYRDPDDNMVELSAVNFAHEEDYLAYFRSDSFKRNPSGVPVDADAYVGRFRSGTALTDLVRIPASTPPPVCPP